VTHLGSATSFRRDYRPFYLAAERARVPVVIGGQAMTERLRKQISFTTFGEGMTDLAKFARTLEPRPGRPARGRPRKPDR
jgi:hypothetical protein